MLPPAVVTAALRATIRPRIPAVDPAEHTARRETRAELRSTIAAMRGAPWFAFETLVESLEEENERLRSRSLLLEEQAEAFKAVIARLEKERTESSRRVSAAEAERDSLRAAVERLRSSSGGGFQGSVSRAVQAVHSLIDSPATAGDAEPSHAEAAPASAEPSHAEAAPASAEGDTEAELPSSLRPVSSAAASRPTASVDTLDSLVDSVRHLLIVLEDAVEREARHASAQSLGGAGSASLWAAPGRDKASSLGPVHSEAADSTKASSLGPVHSEAADSTMGADSDGSQTTAAGAAALSGAGGSHPSVPRVVRGQSVSSRPMGDMLAGGPGRAGRGLSILCLDGGGIKGVCMLEALVHIEKRTGRCIHELFDIICGTSTGGLLATLLAMKRMPLADIPAVYETIRKRMDDHTTVVTNMARFAGGVSYDDKMTEELLREVVGEAKLDEVPSIPKCFVVAAACNSTPAQPYLFRSYELTRAAAAASEFMGASHCKVWEAIRCTTAAPTYYNPAVVGKQQFVDGGILANNPTLIALAEAAVLWPDSTVSCVVSLGTGMPSSRKHTASSALDWAGYIISDLCMSSHVTHAIASSLMGEGQYFRIDPPCVDVALSETRPAVIEGMLTSIRAYLEEEEQQRTIRRIARLLTSRRATSTPAAATAKPSASSSSLSSNSAPAVPAGAAGDHPLSVKSAAPTDDS